MKTYKKTIVTTELCLVIRQDNDCDSPRQDINLGYFITRDRSYKSPDENWLLEKIVAETGDVANDQKHHIKLITEQIEAETNEKVLAIYPVTKYEHSGIVYSLGNYKGFDYSTNGFYIITDKTQDEVGTKKENWEEVIKAEIDAYNKWLNGEVYRFTLYDNDGDVIESCAGFYNIEDIKNCLPEEWKSEDLNNYIKY